MSHPQEIDMNLSRLDCFYLAKLADQAGRHHDVITQLKSLVTSANARFHVDERNLLSAAYKNIVITLRTAWRIIDALARRETTHLDRHLLLIHREKGTIEQELNNICMDMVQLLEQRLIPAANEGEEIVFYYKLKGDYYRYLSEFTHLDTRTRLATLSLDAYRFAYKHALNTLDPMHPTKLGLALNFAVYYHDVLESPERACYLAKHAFDEAIWSTTNGLSQEQNLEDSLMILQLLKDDLMLWAAEIGEGELVN